MTPRRARLVFVLVVLGVVAVAIRLAEPVWWWVTHERVYTEYLGHPGEPKSRGWHTCLRRGQVEDTVSDGPFVLWHTDTGFKEREGENSREVRIFSRSTEWTKNGKVLVQVRAVPRSGGGWRADHKKSPPWWWNVTDQTAPSIPAWMKDDEQWQAALDAQK